MNTIPRHLSFAVIAVLLLLNLLTMLWRSAVPSQAAPPTRPTAKRRTSPPKPKPIQYKVVDVTGGSLVLEKKLNELGKQGWRLVPVATESYRYIFIKQ
jgi:hypothetical protein